MIKSMTGYGTSSHSDGDVSFTVDIKSVNSRYLDVNIRMPSILYPFENDIKKHIKSRLSRGKVDVYIKLESDFDHDVRIEINEPLLHEYLLRAEEISAKYELENNLKLSHFINNTDIFVLNSEDDDDRRKKLFKLAIATMDKSLNSLLEARLAEGESLFIDINKKLDFLSDRVRDIEAKSDKYNTELKKVYFSRLNDLADNFNLDNDRIYTEAAVLVDKACIDEEIVRLGSHIEQFKTVLKAEEPIGKKLDFIVQEMNREANTILSKSKSVELSSIGLEIKTEIEKVREQIQNIE